MMRYGKMQRNALGGFIMNDEKKELSSEQHEELLRALKARFEKNTNRTLLGRTTRRMNIFFMIVQRKVLRV